MDEGMSTGCPLETVMPHWVSTDVNRKLREILERLENRCRFLSTTVLSQSSQRWNQSGSCNQKTNSELYGINGQQVNTISQTSVTVVEPAVDSQASGTVEGTSHRATEQSPNLVKPRHQSVNTLPIITHPIPTTVGLSVPLQEGGANTIFNQFDQAVINDLQKHWLTSRYVLTNARSKSRFSVTRGENHQGKSSGNFLTNAAKGLLELPSDIDHNHLGFEDHQPPGRYCTTSLLPDSTQSSTHDRPRESFLSETRDKKGNFSSSNKRDCDSLYKEYRFTAMDRIKNLPDSCKQYFHPPRTSLSTNDFGSQVNSDRNQTDVSTLLRPRLPAKVQNEAVPLIDWRDQKSLGIALSTNCDRLNSINCNNELYKLGNRVDNTEKIKKDYASIQQDSVVDYVIDAKNLVTQLEQRMLALSKRQQQLTTSYIQSDSMSTHRTPGFKLDEIEQTCEDLEVADLTLSLIDQGSTGFNVNKRILAALRRRAETKQQPEHAEGTVEPGPFFRPSGGRRKEVSRTKSQEPTKRKIDWHGNSYYEDRQNRNFQAQALPSVQSARFLDESGRKNYPNNTTTTKQLIVSDSVRNSRSTGRHQYLQSNCLDREKLTAMVKLQRRKSYDPKQSIGAQTSARKVVNTSLTASTVHSLKKPSPTRTDRTNTTSNNSKTRKPTSYTRCTVPVKTSDCLAAFDRLKSEQSFSPNHRANTQGHTDERLTSSTQVIGWPGKQAMTDTNGDGVADTCARQKVNTLSHFHRRNTPTPSSGHIGVSRLTTSCAGTQNTQDKDTGMTTPHDGNCVTVGHQKETHFQNSRERQTPQGPDYPLSSQKYQESTLASPVCGTSTNNNLSYPDIAVESIRFKVERLTNFIVRLRRRIERDFAEQGTCSPGDDVYGDEAVGATVSGRSTGMHPVVANCLKNVRILEFNAQEIFNLLYPNEVDLWEPAISWLEKGIGNEVAFNEAHSQITDKLSTCVDDMGGQTLSRTVSKPIPQSKVTPGSETTSVSSQCLTCVESVNGMPKDSASTSSPLSTERLN